MKTPEAAYEDLCYYTLSLGDSDFIHQHVVDAFAAQDADENDKPIRLTFALVGLYLHVEKGFTGREVQRAHMKLAQNRREWPRFPMPQKRGDITAVEVEMAPPGPERNRMIDQWCRSAWDAFAENKPFIEALLLEGTVLPSIN